MLKLQLLGVTQRHRANRDKKKRYCILNTELAAGKCDIKHNRVYNKDLH
jgi:hypothetical protein